MVWPCCAICSCPVPCWKAKQSPTALLPPPRVRKALPPSSYCIPPEQLSLPTSAAHFSTLFSSGENTPSFSLNSLGLRCQPITVLVKGTAAVFISDTGYKIIKTCLIHLKFKTFHNLIGKFPRNKVCSLGIELPPKPYSRSGTNSEPVGQALPLSDSFFTKT